MNRLKDNRGETLIESLVSLLILTMTFAFLAVASTTAARLNAKVRDTDVSFRYAAESTDNARIELQGSVSLDGIKSGLQTVTLYENNGYLYYDGGRGYEQTEKQPGHDLYGAAVRRADFDDVHRAGAGGRQSGADNLPGEYGGVGGTGPLLHADNSHQ